jgi:holliday junction DNA helicase RuvA
MIAYLRGRLAEKNPARIVVESNGIGYDLFIPLSSFEALGELGSDVFVLTHLHVREDGIQLFGFATEAERDLFRLLISVSGIGPRSAVAVLSGISTADFREAVRNADIASLMRAPGVGRKTAERLVLELRDKVGESETETPGFPSIIRKTADEAVQALVTLGYKRPKAQELVKQGLDRDKTLSVEELLRKVLSQIG